MRTALKTVGTGLFDRIAGAHMQTGRSVSRKTLDGLFARYPGCRYELYDNVSTAFCELLHSRKQDERIYIAGSLYLAGEIKELLRDDKF